jgi:hypothetical protein
MTRVMYDGLNTDAAAIGAQAQPGDLVAGYGDGLYAWSDADWAHIAPGVIRIVIVVFATTNAGMILDCEPGNCTPGESVDWVLMRRAEGVDPTVYCNEKNLTTGWPAIRAAFQARGVPEPHYWVANYDGVVVVPAGAVGKQYADDTMLGTRWDISVVADYWPGVDPTPTDPPTVRRNDMHADLKLNTPVVFTNPAAVLGGTSHLLLASDFGDATVRIAVFSLKGGAWNVLPLASIGHTAGAYKLTLPPDTNKINVEMTGGSGAVGLDVFA